MKHFIYILKLLPQYSDPGAWTAGTERVIAEHLDHLNNLAVSGVVLHFGRTDKMPGEEGLFGVVVLLAGDEDAALDLMLDDPAVKAEVMTARLFPYKQVFPN